MHKKEELSRSKLRARQEVKRLFTKPFVLSVIMDKGYTKVLPIEMEGGTGPFRVEKQHIVKQRS